MDSQNAEAERPSEDRKIILGGEVFKVNEDLKVIQEENGNEDPQKSQQQTTAINQLRSSRFSKRESTMSMMSSCSVESDWSDEELEELERMLGDIQDRSDAMDNDDDDTCENMNAAIERWKKLRRSRALATQRIKEAAEREEAEAEDGDKGNNNNDGQEDNRVWTTAAAAVSVRAIFSLLLFFARSVFFHPRRHHCNVYKQLFFYVGPLLSLLSLTAPRLLCV